MNEDWTVPQPHVLPRPTYTPAVLALSIVFILWGTITMWAISVVGLVLFAVAAIGWTTELRHEAQELQDAERS